MAKFASPVSARPAEPREQRESEPNSGAASLGPRPLSELGLSDDLVWGLVDAAPDAIILTDEAGQIVLVNQQTEELFGYERVELLGKPIEELVPERFRQLHRANRTRYRAEPRTRAMGSGLELFGRRRDGSEFPVEIGLSPLHSSSGLLVVASVRDISERTEAEAEQRQIHRLLDSTRDAILIFDADTLRFTYVNEGAVQQLGYSREKLLEMTMLHVAPNFTEASLRELLLPVGGGRVSSTMFTTIYRRRDGLDIPVEIVLQAGESELGEPGAFVMLVRDVTERVEAEEQLRQASEELRLLEDRERIARDLHDKVIQRLFAAGMSMQAVAARVAAQNADLATRLDVIVDEIDETIREIRGAIYGLHAQSARRAGLRHEILRIIETESAALGTEPRLRLLGAVDAVPDEIAENLLAVLHEALSNVARHARAAAVEVSVDASEEVVLRVVDDGVGIASDLPAGGHGLRNMAERAARLGGSFRTERLDDRSTVVEWRIPNRGS